MNYIEYKNYLGTVEFSPEDLVFYGKIHGINDLVTFEATNVGDLLSSFHVAVEDYIDLCERYGKSPEKAYSGQFNVRIDSSLHKQLSMQAARDGITLNQCVSRVLAEYCAEPTRGYKTTV
jgi:predicted HicB family RNase H-like nuclease